MAENALSLPIVAYAKNRLLDHQMRFLFPTHEVAKIINQTATPELALPASSFIALAWSR